MNKVDLKKILKKVEKPARYLGNEINSIHKDTSDENLIRYAQCFPDLYEVGMSHLGSHILYDVINREEKIFCERVFAPAIDSTHFPKFQISRHFIGEDTFKHDYHRPSTKAFRQKGRRVQALPAGKAACFQYLSSHNV